MTYTERLHLATDPVLRRFHNRLWVFGWLVFPVMVILSLAGFTYAAGPKALAHWPVVSMILAAIVPVLTGIVWFAVLMDPSGILGQYFSVIKADSDMTPTEQRNHQWKGLGKAYFFLTPILVMSTVFTDLYLGSLLQTANKAGIGVAVLLVGLNVAFLLNVVLLTKTIPRALEMLPTLDHLQPRRHPKHE